jgi:hypothetical protein
MKQDSARLTRRDFMKGVGSAALGVAAGLPSLACGEGETQSPRPARSKVILIRNENVVTADGTMIGELVQQMLDEAVMALFDRESPLECWQQIIKPDDIVGIKTNVIYYLPSPQEVNEAIRSRVRQAGVPDESIAMGDRGIYMDEVFQRTTALVNTRPMRTHAWSGVGSLIKNYITFVPRPSDYHYDACADLAALWDLPITRGKTRLNVLVMLTPQFHNVGPHHFDPIYVWPYGGLIVSTDPVAADSVGLRIIQEKRQLAFGEDRPLQPTAHHIALADTVHHLGNADPSKIDLVKLGWDEDILI